MVVVTAGMLVANAPASAVSASFAATCITTGSPHGPVTDHRTFTYSAHAPDSVAPGASFTVSTDVGYAVPPDATLAASFFDVSGATTEAAVVPADPGAPSIQGDLGLGATGAFGSAVVVTLREFGSLTYVGSLQLIELCAPDHPLTVASVPIGMPSVSVGDVAVVEGSSGTRALGFPVSLSRPAATNVTVAFDTEDGSAAAGSDYVAGSGTVTIFAGSVTGVARVRVRGDTAVEPKESFRLRLRDPVSAALGRATGTGRIIDDDPEPGPRISVGDGSIVEGARGTRSARFTISMSSPATERVTFHFTSSDGTAVGGSDYHVVGYDGVINPGGTSATLPVPVSPDRTSEPTESFTVTLSGVTGAAIGRANGVGTILDDD
jgi:hypothetical protein